MSELMNVSARRNAVRWHLLTTVSVLAVIGFVSETTVANADDDGRPTVWIQLGGQLSRLQDSQETLSPPLMNVRPSIFSPSPPFEKMPLNSIEENGVISLQPDNSDWIFSASARYGRSVGHTHEHQQTNPKGKVFYLGGYRYSKYPSAEKFADTNAQNSEHHLIVDFQAGKDVGLGMFGSGSSSILSFGVRYAQFGASSNIVLRSNPDWHFNYKYRSGTKIVLGGTYHTNAASVVASRSFHGIGPSLSWNASAPLMHNGQNSDLTLDWGLNGAVLFGRQRTKVHYQTTGAYHTAKYPSSALRNVINHTSAKFERAHNVVVPNIGGFAGLSFRYSNAKVSFGYRADLFFNAMDGGISQRKSETLGFYGPFAAVSIGLGG